jgi:hypothetical protein
LRAQIGCLGGVWGGTPALADMCACRCH